MSSFTQDRLDLAAQHIEGLDVNPAAYKSVQANIVTLFGLLIRGCWLRLKNGSGNHLYQKPSRKKHRLEIKFSKGARGNRVFIGEDFQGKLRLKISASNCTAYIGNQADFGSVMVDMYQDESVVAIGNNVTTGPNTSVYCNEKESGVIVGDDCMFSRDISLRSTDGHPIYNAENYEQTNLALAPIVVEPHVWVGQGVTVLKGVIVGAGSVLGAGSVAVKDIARYSAAAGVPAKSRNTQGIVWARSDDEASLIKTKHYQSKYPSQNETIK